MRNIFALIGLVVVGFAGVGWYCGWYKVSIDKNSDGTLQIKTEVHTDKVTEDSSAFFQKVGQIVGEKADKSGKTAQPTTTPGNTPGPVAPVGPANGKDANITPANTKDRSGVFNGGWLLSPTKPISTIRP